MALPYRALFRLADDDDAIRVASEQFRGWLKEKATGRRATLTERDWDGEGIHQVGPRAVLQVVRHAGEDGSDRLLLELRETGDTGTWITRLTAASLPSSRRLKQAIWIVTESADDQTPKPPRLARRILEATDVWNGDVPVTATPELIDIDRVDEVFDHIVDDNRDLSLVVASPIGGPTETWRAAIEKLTSDSVGVATAYVLNEQAFEHLNSRLPDTHQVPRGSVRTYLPQADLEDPSDSRRHRVLGPATMNRAFSRGRFADWLVTRHSRSAREHLAKVTLPADLLRVENILERTRLEQQRQSPSAVEAPRPVASTLDSVADAAEIVHQAGDWLVNRMRLLVERFTGRPEVDETAVDTLEKLLDRTIAERSQASEQIDKLLDRANELAAERDAVSKQLEYEQLEREIAEQDRRAAESKHRALLQWKKQQGLEEYVGDAEVLSDWEQEPDSVRELVMRFDNDPQFAEITQYVEMTGVQKAYDNADEIDARDGIGRYGPAFWEYVLILRDYAIAYKNGFGGGVHDYLLADQIGGRKCSTQRHKPKESEQVAANTKWRKARMLAVPLSVDASGEVYMEAHFAPTHRDTSAPRMHYYSDVANTGKIYIGYIGRHLPNTKTN